MGRRPSFSGVQGWFGRDSGVNIDLRRGSPDFGVRVDTRQAIGNAIGVRPSDIHRYAERPIERVDQAWQRGSGPFHPDGAGGFRALGDRIGGVFRGIFGGGRDRDGYYDDRRGPPERGSNFQYDRDPRDVDRGRGRGRDRDYPRESGPEFQRPSPATGRGRDGVEVGTDDFTPLQTNPETIRALDDFQTKINSGTVGQLSDRDLYTRVSQAWTREKPAALQMFENGGFAKTRAGMNEFINFTREAEQNPGMLSLHEQLQANPAMAREIVDQWRKDVGAEASSPSYKGGKATIVDRLSEATNDPAKFDAMLKAKTLAELNTAAGAGTTPVVPNLRQFSEISPQIPFNELQETINTGSMSKLSDAELMAKIGGSGNEREFTQLGFARTRAGMNEMLNYGREVSQNPDLMKLHDNLEKNPSLRREILDQWRQELGTESSSPNYRGGKETILDRLNAATKDPAKFEAMLKAKTLAELNTAAGVQPAAQAAVAPLGSRAVPQAGDVKPVEIPASMAQQAPAAAAPVVATAAATPAAATPAAATPAAATPAAPATPASSSSLYASGTPVDTKMLNELSGKGIMAEMRMREIDGSTHLFADRNGKIVGGYTSNAQGQTQNFLSLDDVTKKLADAGKTVDGMERDIQLARNSGMKPATQMADAAPGIANGPGSSPAKSALSIPDAMAGRLG